ncbi:hypothetical protein [Paraburkholderia sp.]|uniref:hypothetical protein n=1 Tax=Paraburkholderia sp. TaxID=1926495 RepID=UPI0025E86410|nr:hypothetical protein [Paraburkholderia sp.]
MQRVHPAQQRSRKKKADKLAFLKQTFVVVGWLVKIFRVVNLAASELMKLWHLFF